MRPILISGHVRLPLPRAHFPPAAPPPRTSPHHHQTNTSLQERALTQVKYNADGDLIFSVSKDHTICVWFSANGERLGTYKGHQGALWTICPDPTTTVLASGGADNTIRLWAIASGALLKTWDCNTAVKRIDIDEFGKRMLAVTEKRMGFLGTILVYDVHTTDPAAPQPDEPALRIELPDSKATVAGFGPLGREIIAGHEDGSISQFDAETGELIYRQQAVHAEPITDIQFGPDRTYFATSSKDKTAKLHDTKTLETLKTYVTDTPLNSAAITPVKDYVILGGGQAAMDVTTTAARQGKFEARIYHKIFEDEIGRVRGHFGPLNTVAVHPKGEGYCSGGEDGYVRIHHFDPNYFRFQYEVEKETAPKM